MRVKAGDFTGLAADYSRNRPGYSKSVLKALLGLVGKRINDIDYVDIGAGTGIFTRMVHDQGVRTSIAVEPNDDMRSYGIAYSKSSSIRWVPGSAEKTGLDSSSADLLSMASSFHWADFEAATTEFNRILRPGGKFVAIWNPRLIEVSPLLMEIENYLKLLKKDIKRVSSGRSGMTEQIIDKLLGSSLFEDVIYIEGRHVVKMTRERYLGAWRSVNDLQVQLGPEKFDEFMTYVEDKVANLSSIDATYLTRAWSASRA